MSFDPLIEKIVALQNPTVLGLDPTLAYIPNFIKEQAYHTHGHTLEGAADAILTFNKGLIDALCDIVPAVKPQCAYYEMHGWQGVKAMCETIAYAKQKGMYVIIDGKRNDIGSTMGAYSSAHLGTVQVEDTTYTPFGGDSLTVNGYLGSDGITPLLADMKAYDKGIWVLVKTSNPSSGQLQDKQLEGATLYETMGALCESWGAENMGKYGYSGVGAVVGATYPKQLKELREKCPHTFFLVPGYGAQGGGGQDVAHAFDENGLGACINSSRGLMCAYQKREDLDETQYAQAAREAAIRMREDILSHLGGQLRLAK